MSEVSTIIPSPFSWRRVRVRGDKKSSPDLLPPSAKGAKMVKEFHFENIRRKFPDTQCKNRLVSFKT
jgi:hypothetical protein